MLQDTSIDPVVYLKMMMVGFFENLPSERAFAARCGDSFSIREFLHYELTEATPEHSSLTIIRQRLQGPVFEAVFSLVLSALQQHGLVRGRNLGIDSSVMEANASLRGLENRNTREAYWDYVKRLAQASGVDPDDGGAVRRFDRKRTKKMSNQEWENPNDPDANIGPKKDGATDMVYKPETVVDLDSGAIVGAQVLPGDQPDQKEVSLRIMEAQQTLMTILANDDSSLPTQTITADKGYFNVPELKALQDQGFKTMICDPVQNRKMERLEQTDRLTVKAARRSTQTKQGKKLLRRRGMHLERAFAHILDCGGMRRATLRGIQNLYKRFQLAAAFYNLSQLMRELFGIGTPKQWAVAGRAGLLVLLRLFLVEWEHLWPSSDPKPETQENIRKEPVILTFHGIPVEFLEYRFSSTGC